MHRKQRIQLPNNKTTMMELKDMTFLEVLQLRIFKEELEKQIYIEIAAYNDVSKRGKLKRMAMDRLRERGHLNTKDLTVEYYHIMHKEADRDTFSANERQYIQDVCTLAYTRTIRRIQSEIRYEKEHPYKAKMKEYWVRFKRWFREKANRRKKV